MSIVTDDNPRNHRTRHRSWQDTAYMFVLAVDVSHSPAKPMMSSPVESWLKKRGWPERQLRVAQHDPTAVPKAPLPTQQRPSARGARRPRLRPRPRCGWGPAGPSARPPCRRPHGAGRAAAPLPAGRASPGWPQQANARPFSTDTESKRRQAPSIISAPPHTPQRAPSGSPPAMAAPHGGEGLLPPKPLTEPDMKRPRPWGTGCSSAIRDAAVGGHRRLVGKGLERRSPGVMGWNPQGSFIDDS